MKKINLSDIILILLFLFAIGLALWYFFGNSPTLEEVILTFLLTVVFTIGVNMGRSWIKINYIERDLKSLKIDIKSSFERIKDDMNLIKNKMRIK